MVRAAKSEEYLGTADIAAIPAIWKNLKEFPRALSWSAAMSGLLIVLISSTGPVAILLQAARAGHFTDRQTASWLFACWAGPGIFGLFLSLRLRMPVIGAWSTPSVALLVTGLATHNLREAVGAYFISAVLITIIGITGFLERILSAIPRPVIMAMLGGVLFEFGVNIFRTLPNEPVIVIAMVLGYFLARRFAWRAPVVTSAGVGLVLTIIAGKAHFSRFNFSIVHPVWVNPSFTISGLITLALPLTLLTLTTQYAPGLAVLTGAGYRAPVNRALVWGGLISVATAGMLGSGTNSAAITAAIGSGEQAEPDKTRRYSAGVVCGIFYLIVGILGATMLGLFGALPGAMLAALAGLGLLPAIANSTHDALEDPQYREAALITFLVTVSNIHPLKLGSPFWGLVAGFIVHYIVEFKGRKK
jgi:benzoate membrane transport protein